MTSFSTIRGSELLKGFVDNEIEKAKKGVQHAKHKYLEIKDGKYIYDHSKMTDEDHKEVSLLHQVFSKKYAENNHHDTAMYHAKLSVEHNKLKQDKKTYPTSGAKVKILSGKNKGKEGKVLDDGRNKYRVVDIFNQDEVLFTGTYGDDLDANHLKVVTVEKAITDDDIEKARSFPEGHISTYGGKKYRKTNGKWVAVDMSPTVKTQEGIDKNAKETEEQIKNNPHLNEKPVVETSHIQETPEESLKKVSTPELKDLVNKLATTTDVEKPYAMVMAINKEIAEREKPSIVVDKDWKRMMDLVLAGDNDGKRVASSITDKKKSIARFVSGVKLENSKPNYNVNWKEYRGYFSELGNRALKLGATVEEIQKEFDNAVIPTKIADELKRLGSKKLKDRFVGTLSKAILDEGYDIEYLPTNGNALTMDGRYAMERNGRKWTIGYKTVISVGDKKVNLAFDAITDEGDGPTSFVIHSSGSDRAFNIWRPVGKREFTLSILKSLGVIKEAEEKAKKESRDSRAGSAKLMRLLAGHLD